MAESLFLAYNFIPINKILISKFRYFLSESRNIFAAYERPQKAQLFAQMIEVTLFKMLFSGLNYIRRNGDKGKEAIFGELFWHMNLIVNFLTYGSQTGVIKETLV